MWEALKNQGYSYSSFEDADVVVLNACTVTQSAERDIRRFISKVRRKNPKAKIVLTGCHAQVYPERNFGCDLVLGQKEKFLIADFLAKKGVYVARLEDDGIPDIFLFEPQSSGRTRFFLKIQDGCDKFCTYCIVPYARGKPRSQSASRIIQIMEELKKKGFNEVVLSGIEIASYYDPVANLDLKGLLRVLEEVETPKRIRLSSVDPLYVDREFIDILASSKKIAKSIHLPIQSGADAILKRMGRKYTAENVAEVVRELKARVDNIGIGADIIVGFPKEGESEFEETRKFIESLELSYLHVFPFSPREKTVAFNMEDKIDEEVKRKRVKIMKELDRKIRTSFYEKNIGRKLTILTEKKVYYHCYMRGFSENYIPVLVKYDSSCVNQFLDVTIVSIKDGKVFGSIVN